MSDGAVSRPAVDSLITMGREEKHVIEAGSRTKGRKRHRQNESV